MSVSAKACRRIGPRVDAGSLVRTRADVQASRQPAPGSRPRNGCRRDRGVWRDTIGAAVGFAAPRASRNCYCTTLVIARQLPAAATAGNATIHRKVTGALMASLCKDGPHLGRVLTMIANTDFLIAAPPGLPDISL